MINKTQATPLIDTSREDFVLRYRRAEHLDQIKEEENERNANRYIAWIEKHGHETLSAGDDRLSIRKCAILIALLSVGIWTLILWLVLFLTG